VRAGTSSGSLPQDEDVVTPPVALSETEHGMPRRLSAGSIWLPDDAVPGACAPGVPAIEPAAAGDAAGFVVCACAGARIMRAKIAAKMNKRFMATLHA
jgi:hypothetical protein